MSLFRSDEHVERWRAAQGYDRGEIVDLPRRWALARSWYTDPRARDWCPRSRDESQRVLTSVGLVGDFWELPR